MRYTPEQMDINISYMALPGLIEKPEFMKVKSLNVDEIVKCVCNFFSESIDEVIGKSRAQNIVTARYVAFYFIKTYTSLSLKRIGEKFGNRDHTTVIHGLKTIQDHMEKEPHIMKSVEAIRAQIV